MQENFPKTLQKGVRVLKQNRGSAGEGIWRVEVLENGKNKSKEKMIPNLLNVSKLGITFFIKIPLYFLIKIGVNLLPLHVFLNRLVRPSRSISYCQTSLNNLIQKKLNDIRSKNNSD